MNVKGSGLNHEKEVIWNRWLERVYDACQRPYS